ncbi:MAG: hypothetical protein ABI855_19500 [Bacteroidota bacterium]
MSFQNIVVIILFIAAALYIAKRIYNNMRHDGTKEGCAKCDVIKENKKAS